MLEAARQQLVPAVAETLEYARGKATGELNMSKTRKWLYQVCGTMKLTRINVPMVQKYV
jgi:hypothetical protein